MYVLNKIVNRAFGRHLDERDAEQAMGVWLLDAVVTQPLRDKLPAVQGVFHSLDFDVKDALQAGMKIHVYCDNLANMGLLVYDADYAGKGFLSKKEGQLYVPEEDNYEVSNTFRRRILQCGLDMLVVRENRESLKQYFDYATVWARKKDSVDKIYSTFVKLLDKKLENGSIEGIDNTFIDETLKQACSKGLLQAVIKYSHGIDYMMSDWRRSKFARDEAKKFKAKGFKEPAENYCAVVSVKDLIRSNFKHLDNWKKDIDNAASSIIEYSVKNPESSVLQAFSR